MFRVDWTPSALEELAAIWMAADDSLRRPITAAAEKIDAELSASADEVGESCVESFRVHWVAPLGFDFHVHRPSQTAAVIRIWLVRKRA